MSITFNKTISNPRLPVGADLADVISADPALRFWGTADADFATISAGEFLSFQDRAGGAGAFAANASFSRAAVVGDALAGQSVARFAGYPGTDFDVYTSTGVTIAQDAAVTLAAIFRPKTLDQSQAILGRFLGADDRCVLQFSTGNVPRFLCQGAFVDGVAVALDEWCLVVASFDGAVSRIWQDGAERASITPPDGTTHTGAFLLGSLDGTTNQRADVEIADFWVFGRDLIGGDSETLDAIAEYAATVYGLDVG